jgi:hypothetical protein
MFTTTTDEHNWQGCAQGERVRPGLNKETSWSWRVRLIHIIGKGWFKVSGCGEQVMSQSWRARINVSIGKGAFVVSAWSVKKGKWTEAGEYRNNWQGAFEVSGRGEHE